ncbi:MAG: hypothetical protein U0168_15725 [Nannocystaceae bacterium]
MRTKAVIRAISLFVRAAAASRRASFEQAERTVDALVSETPLSVRDVDLQRLATRTSTKSPRSVWCGAPAVFAA